MVHILWYTGGKSHLFNKIKEYIPEHRYYLEPFGGGGVVLFNKEPRFDVYIASELQMSQAVVGS